MVLSSSETVHFVRERGDRLAVLVERDQGVVDGGQVRTVEADVGEGRIPGRDVQEVADVEVVGAFAAAAARSPASWRLRRRSSW
jgi:hypothetical protein